MDSGVKWIGGLTLAVAALVGSALVVGNPLEAQEDPEIELTAEDVLGEELAHAGEERFYGNDPVAPEDRHIEAADVDGDAQPYDPDDPFVIRRVLPIEGPIRYGEWHWNEEGAPEDGRLIMTVDLQARVISVFRGGYEIGAAAALLGTADHPTPTGTFPILTKERHNVSEKYNNAPMPWTLRLTWDGIAIHGGSTVERGYASHGCIGVPDEFVSRLYDIARVGDVVIITDGVMTGVGGSLNPEG